MTKTILSEETQELLDEVYDAELALEFIEKHGEENFVEYFEQYEFIKLYDILRDMDFELTPLQVSVFEKVMDSSHNLYYQGA